MSLNGIMSSALSSLQTNTSALKVVSQNIANLNTPDYVRRQVNLSVLGSNGVPAGVTIDDVTRVTDQYLQQESLSATASSSQYDTMSSVFDQINALLGSPGDGSSLSSKLSDVLNKLGAAQLSTGTGSSQASVVDSMKSLATSISTMSDQLDSLSSQADQQLSTSVTDAATQIKQIYDYNKLIKSSYLQGDTDTTYLDQRDAALNSLAKDMDIRVTNQEDGTIQVTTQDGINLVGSASYAKLTYTPGADNVYGTITAQDSNGSTGQPIGTPQALDDHLTGGSMRGLIDIRDSTIAGVKNELGELAKGVANAFNEVHNESSAYPPPSVLTGRDTGLLASDSLNFSGATLIALTDASGVERHMVDIDFDAGTVSVDGGATSGFSNNIGSFTSTLNDALSSVGGNADFTNGALTVNGGDFRVAVGDPDSTNASSRSGTGFSQFFGLNDLFTTSVPSISNTGMTSGDALGLSSNGVMKFVVKNANGSVARSADVAITAGMTVDDAVNAINSSLTGYAQVKLDDNGALITTMDNNYSGYSLQVASDSTLRGTTGISVSALFGLGANALGNVASGFQVNPDIVSSPSLISFAQPNMSSPTGQIVASGDSSGLLALQALATTQFSFEKAGNLGAQTTSLQNYAGAFYQDIATQSASAASNKTTQDDRLTEAQSRQSNNSGVNLDEELSNMIMYQKAYSAGARLLSTVNQLYDTLLAIQ